MPAKNTLKLDEVNSYYHVYARGVAKLPIFMDDQDFSYFIQLFSRYLSIEAVVSKAGVVYPHYRGQIELLSYCLMSNHFHLLVYQHQQTALTSLMRSVMTAYSKYFNLRYKRTGPVFESRYKAVRIDSDTYLSHISRYIHMNPRYYITYKYSSYTAYVNGSAPEWLQTERISGMFESGDRYASFCSDYVDRRKVLQRVKTELADY